MSTDDRPPAPAGEAQHTVELPLPPVAHIEAKARLLLLFMLLLAPLVRYIPLASLAAVLVVVAWNMAEIEQFTHLMSAPPGDRLVLQGGEVEVADGTIFSDLRFFPRKPKEQTRQEREEARQAGTLKADEQLRSRLFPKSPTAEFRSAFTDTQES